RRDEVERRRQVQFVLAVAPPLRQLKRRTMTLLRRFLEGAAERRLKWQLFAIGFVAFHNAERQAQRERGIRGHVAAVLPESRRVDLRIGLAFRLIDLVLEALA